MINFEYPKPTYDYPFLEAQKDYDHPVWYKGHKEPLNWNHLEAPAIRKHMERLNGERQAVFNLLNHMREHGWECYMVFNGEEEILVTTTELAMEHVFSVDDSHMYFSKNGKTHWAYIVLGNSPEEIICDHTYSKDGTDDFDTAIKQFYEED